MINAVIDKIRAFFGLMMFIGQQIHHYCIHHLIFNKDFEHRKPIVNLL